MGLAEKVWEEYVRGGLEAGQPVATVKAISERYGVSINVAQGAVRLLARQGLIEARRGRGCVLQVRPADRPRPILTSTSVVLDLPISGSAYFRRYAREITRMGHQSGLHVYIYDSFLHGSREAEMRTLQDASEGKFGAVVLFNVAVGNHLRPYLKAIRRKGIPVIFLERQPKDLEGRWDVVGPDDVAGGRLVGRELLTMGHRRIVHLGRLDKPEDATGLRLRGLREALSKCGVGLSEKQCFEVGDPPWWMREGGAESLKRWLAKQKPTAITLFTDIYFRYLTPVLEQLGWSVGREVSVVGYDASPEDAGTKDLASVDPRHEEIGRQVVKLLEKRLKGDQSGPFHQLVDPKFIPGASLTTLSG
jgi:DNA-binding LacI/PurR family transcriptional regulator